MNKVIKEIQHSKVSQRIFLKLAEKTNFNEFNTDYDNFGTFDDPNYTRNSKNSRQFIRQSEAINFESQN